MSSGQKEFTLVAVLTGLIVGVIMTAANVYLGLYAGMTVSASIPAAVIAVAVLRALRRSSILEANIVQTMASAGESIAAGVIFTVPALVLVGVWTKFHFWPTTLIAVCGGLLGVIFMVPLRKALILDSKELTYPEGVACATVLESTTKPVDATDAEATNSSGVANILKGLGLGALFKFLIKGLNFFKGEAAVATQSGSHVFFFGTDISPALVAVGYIVGLQVAAMVFLGGAIGWVGVLPFMQAATDSPALDNAWSLWSTQIRYLGVGAMIVGGLWSIFSVRQGIQAGLQGLKKSYTSNEAVDRTHTDMNIVSLLIVFLLAVVAMFFIYDQLIGRLGLTLFTTLLMTVASFLFVAVSSYVVGLVGSSNNPVSGMTISALLGTAAFFLVMGYQGESAILATLGVAAVVCCAACTAGDCSQDLKTGALVKATPKFQQWSQIIGVTLPVLVIAPVLTVLHSSYGIGDGLKAPQATLFASLVQGLFGDHALPYDMVGFGVLLGLLILIGDWLLKSGQSNIRLYVMPVAVGVYLPITLSVPIILGGLVSYWVQKQKASSSANLHDNGILLGSGLVAGEAIMGVILAVITFVSVKGGESSIASKLIGGFDVLPHAAAELVSLAALMLLVFYLHKVASKG